MSSFHYEFILSKRSSLAKVWLAAHWEKKLSKVQVFETNLQSSVHDILNPRTPIALRTSSHLLVGLVRIYSRKAKYLLTDCSETLVNIKVAFRPGVSALKQPKKRKSAQDMLDCPLFITEKVDLLDQWVPEVSNAEMDCSLNQSKMEEITLQEEPMKVNTLEDYFDDEGFGDMCESDFSLQGLKDCESVFSRVYSFADSGCGTEDGFLGETCSYNDFSDPYFLTPVKEDNNDRLNISNEIDLEKVKDKAPLFAMEFDDDVPVETRTPFLHLEPLLEIPLEQFNENNSDVFALDPVEKRTPLRRRKSLKRKLLVDQEISIQREAFFDQLNDTTNLLSQPVFASPTKRRMKENERDNLKSLDILISYLHNPLSPCLKNILQCPHFHKNSTSSEAVPEREVAVFDRNEMDDLMEDNDFNSVFIPLRDIEYSSDEDEMARPVRDSVSSFPDSTGAFSSEVRSPGIRDDTCSDFDQEDDMSHDEFCAFVERTVMKASPNPVEFSRLVSNDVTMTRKGVARGFLKCLLMQRDARIHLEQTSHFSEILLHAGATQAPNVQIS